MIYQKSAVKYDIVRIHEREKFTIVLVLHKVVKPGNLNSSFVSRL